jgi:hypothetical protein
MTQKEKAINLIRKFNTNDNFDFLGGVKRAKQCALIAVDEILTAIDWHEFETPNKQIEYWQEVKQEIENL